MRKSVVFLFLVCCGFSALSFAEEKNNIDPPATVATPKPFTSEPKKTTTPAKPTTTTPAKPTTTTPAKPTTTTTAKPTTTTTAKPTTTTTAKPTTTTTAKPTTTTTAKPTTTTTAKPTTTTVKTTTAPPVPGPTPPANLTVGSYNVTINSVICLKANMAVQLRVATKEANGTFIVQPAATTASGNCGGKDGNLTLSFKEGFITFLFNKSADNTGYVYSLSFKIDYAFVQGQTKTYTATNSTVHLFSAKVGHSYSCTSDSVFMGDGLYLDITQDKMQAFGLDKDHIDFGTPDHCAADQTDYRVAIGVGIALLVLIVIVVVAYLVTRKRRTDGYQSL